MYGLISQTLMQMIDTIMGWKWDTIFQIFWKEMQENSNVQVAAHIDDFKVCWVGSYN
jgi:hypothetical protein